MSFSDTISDLKTIFEAVLFEIDPKKRLAEVIRKDKDGIYIQERRVTGSLVVLALGKAASQMAFDVECIVGSRITKGLVVTKLNHTVPLTHCSCIESSHPVPTELSEKAAYAVKSFVSGLTSKDQLLVLLSGGTSSLIASPLPGISLDDMRVTTSRLLESGASIEEFNSVRKHLTDLSGGRLLSLVPCPVELLVISDVLSDRLECIGSGPFTPDTTTFQEAYEVIKKYNLISKVPLAVTSFLEKGMEGQIEESPKPQTLLEKEYYPLILSSNKEAIKAAAHAAKEKGYLPYILKMPLVGEAKEAGKALAIMAKKISKMCSQPIMIITGGETTVTLGAFYGKGGRCQELALAAALELNGDPNIAILAAGTDGTDGPTDAAGAFIDFSHILSTEMRDSAQKALDEHNAYPFFKKIQCLYITGPTGNNVNDLVLIAIYPFSNKNK